MEPVAGQGTGQPLTEDDLRTLLQMTQGISQEPDEEGVYRWVRDTVLSLLDAPLVALVVEEPRGEVPAAYANLEDTRLPGRVARRMARLARDHPGGTGKLTVIPPYAVPEEVRIRGMEEVLAVPVRTLSRRLGAVVAGARDSGPEDPRIRFILTTVANQAAARLENLYLHREAARRAERLTSIYEGSRDAILVLDPEEDRIIEANPRACALFGYFHEDLVDVPLSRIYPEAIAHLTAVLRSRFEHARAWTGELECRTMGGKALATEVSASAVEYGDGEYLLAVVRDITARKEAEETLERYAEELARSNAELESFAYAVSHDLRAPLRAIDGYSRMLLEDHAEGLEPEARRFLRVVCDNTRKMGSLIDDLLGYSRLGRQEMKPVPVDLGEMAHSVFDELADADAEGRIEFRVGSLPRARGDRTMLRRALTNLISNALKYSRPRSRALIEVGGEVRGDEAVYHVRDNGVGFEEEHAETIFGVFRRLHTPEEFEGTGVGLALVQRIIDRHGGRVWAERRRDEGATIYFTLPVEGVTR